MKSAQGTTRAPARLAEAVRVVVLLGLLTAGGLPVSGATTSVTVTGSFPNYSYSPKVISIQVGDKVIWNGLSSIHSVTGDTPPETLCGSSFPGNCTNIFNTAGSYRYHCINHAGSGMTGLVNVAAAPLPPTVIITNPLAGTVFAQPASVHISATATNSTGSVTNVQFFSNGGLLGMVTSPPFGFTTTPLTAGAYALTAKATATTGLSATSAPVNITVVTPTTISNFLPRVTNGVFAFKHTANPGLRYVVQHTTNFSAWSSMATNTATSNSIEVMDSFQLGNLRFYRVGRLPNP